MTKQAELKKQAYESDLKSRALSVLIYLIDRSNKELTCFPAIGTMAKQLHVSVSTVKRALKELVVEGYITKGARFRDNRGQTSNLYTLITKNNNSEKNGIKNNQNSDKTIEYITFETLKEKLIINQISDDKGVLIRSIDTVKTCIHFYIIQSQLGFICRYELFYFINQILSNPGRFSRWTGERGILVPP